MEVRGLPLPFLLRALPALPSIRLHFSSLVEMFILFEWMGFSFSAQFSFSHVAKIRLTILIGDDMVLLYEL